jgi:ABC-type transport system involved in multi-copper enzyme maturation permease subunit
MTAPTHTPPVTKARESSPTHRPVTFWSTLRFELLKLHTLRSTVYLLLGCALLLIVMGSIAAASATGSVEAGGPGGGGPPAFDTDDPVATVLIATDFATLIIGVFGCLAIAREYASGMMRTSLTAVPRRLTALGAKVTAVSLTSIVPAMVGVFGAFLLGNAILDAGDVASASLRDGEVLRAVIGTGFYLVAIAVIGLALGVLLRSVAAGISTLVAAVLIVPTFAGLLLPESWDTALQFLPSNAGAALMATSTSTNATELLSPVAGMAALAAWVVLALGAAAWSFVQRDA